MTIVLSTKGGYFVLKHPSMVQLASELGASSYLRKGFHHTLRAFCSRINIINLITTHITCKLQNFMRKITHRIHEIN